MSNKHSNTKLADTVVVLDFETSGLSPDMGDRAIEIGAVLIEKGRVTDKFQQLMNPGFRVSAFIEHYTGISNIMLQKSEPCSGVMKEFAEFVGNHNLVAHNASFDRKFLDAELSRVNRQYGGSFACSMLIARRLFQNAPNHKLGTLVKYRQLPTDDLYHRALADAEMTAHLWLDMLENLSDRHGLHEVPFQVMQQLARTSKASVGRFLEQVAGEVN